jgi:hypothetical protein
LFITLLLPVLTNCRRLKNCAATPKDAATGPNTAGQRIAGRAGRFASWKVSVYLPQALNGNLAGDLPAGANAQANTAFSGLRNRGGRDVRRGWERSQVSEEIIQAFFGLIGGTDRSLLVKFTELKFIAKIGGVFGCDRLDGGNQTLLRGRGRIKPAVETAMDVRLAIRADVPAPGCVPQAQLFLAIKAAF